MRTIDRQEMIHLNRRAGFHWFSPNAMRFFRSRVAQQGYISADGRRAFFWSSERFSDDAPRLYSVRVINLMTGNVDTVGEFQGYKTREAAETEAKRLAEGGQL